MQRLHALRSAVENRTSQFTLNNFRDCALGQYCQHTGQDVHDVLFRSLRTSHMNIALHFEITEYDAIILFRGDSRPAHNTREAWLAKYDEWLDEKMASTPTPTPVEVEVSLTA